jgi:hypothetical protein
VEDSYEHGNEPSSSIKGGESFHHLSVLSASQGGLCSMGWLVLVCCLVTGGRTDMKLFFFFETCLKI